VNRPGKLPQERIGVHPKDWKLEPWAEKMLKGCDAGIRDAMRLMCAGDFETYESCQGGNGHSYAEPTIAFHGGPSEGFRALAWLRSFGVIPTDLRRVWTIEDGEPHGPYWNVVFAPRKKL